MRPSSRDERIANSLLDFVTEGKFPDSEDIISADISSTLPEASQLLSKAREQAQVGTPRLCASPTNVR
jgi:protein transport protein DSL1/ZW10